MHQCSIYVKAVGSTFIKFKLYYSICQGIMLRTRKIFKKPTWRLCIKDGHHFT